MRRLRDEAEVRVVKRIASSHSLQTMGHNSFKIRKEIMTTIFNKITSDGLEGMGLAT